MPGCELFEKPAPWALAEAHSVIDLEKPVKYCYSTGERIENEEDVYQYALKLTRKYGHDEGRARQKYSEAIASGTDMDERIIAVTQYATGEVQAPYTRLIDVSENDKAPKITVDPVQYQPTHKRLQEIFPDAPEGNRTCEAAFPQGKVIPFPVEYDEPYDPLIWGFRKRRPWK